MIWFTSDLHLGHEAVIKMQDRPFADVREMDDALIHNINECVGDNDTLYILGDISHHISAEETNTLIKRIYGKKHLLLGNHDVTGEPEHCQYDESLFVSVGYYKKINAYNLNIIMMHFPMLSWSKATAGSVMLHGHIHSGPEYNEADMKAGIRRFDVGVDANNYYPVSIMQVKQWVAETPVSITSRENLYIPGVWTAEPVTLGKFEAEHPDRELVVYDSQSGNAEVEDFHQDMFLQRKVIDAHSVGDGVWNVTV